MSSQHNAMLSELDERLESMILSDEEKRYYRALLQWEPKDAEEHTGKKKAQERPIAGQFRVLILGSKGCGKTAILTRFSEGSFTSEGQPSNRERESGCQHTLEIKDQTYVVDALELAPDQLFEEQYLQHAVAITEAVVLIYDVRSRDSFNLVLKLHGKIREALFQGKREHYGMMLVGNKADGGESEKEGTCRVVSEGEGYELACNIGYGRTRCAFREASARTGENVDGIFTLLGTELLRSRRVAQQRQEQAEAEHLAILRAMSEADVYEAEELPRKVAKWQVWRKCFRRASEDIERKTATV
ncbi:P-loop containing nucleoside triphosphate hydrolase protein [Astrocystis sublimbata]|nr:P-loop containing nucleoside triphosphate hydrolase protein [Astrocystis sublimbata]